jgi:hypothetical protein
VVHMGEVRGAYNILVGKPEGMRPLGVIFYSSKYGNCIVIIENIFLCVNSCR